jgi:hypothetical protein
MKVKHLTPIVLMLLSLTALQVQAQNETLPDATGLPGDNFSLQGALEMFKKAGSPEEFEKLLNTQDNKVNNLDLDQDGNTDYIKVINKKENDVQVFVLQAQVSEKESQDIAVIELEKTGKDNAVIEIVGDEDIFGEETIVEPESDDKSAFNEGMQSMAGGPNMENEIDYSPTGIIVNVWAWPCVRFVYAPAYTLWVSPWSWHARPMWWHPWRPFGWAVYRPYRYHYAPHYAVVTTRRVVYAPRIYRPMRVTSVTVTTRHRVAVNNYRVARKTTTVRTHHGRATRTTTVVRRRRR